MDHPGRGSEKNATSWDTIGISWNEPRKRAPARKHHAESKPLETPECIRTSKVTTEELRREETAQTLFAACENLLHADCPVKNKWGIRGNDLIHAETAPLASEEQKLPSSALAPREETDSATAVLRAKRAEVQNWRVRHVFEFAPGTAVYKPALHTLWALTWKLARDGAPLVKARMAPKTCPGMAFRVPIWQQTKS